MSRTRVAYLGQAPQWCVVAVDPGSPHLRVRVSSHRILRPKHFVGLVPVAGVLVDTAGFMGAVGLERLPVWLGWDEAVSSLGGVRCDPAVLRLGSRLDGGSGLLLRWATATAQATAR